MERIRINGEDLRGTELIATHVLRWITARAWILGILWGLLVLPGSR